MIKVFISICTLVLFLVLFISLSGCNDGIEVRQNYDFTLTTWHLPTTIRAGEEVEIRFTLRRAGNFAGTYYRIGHVQLVGEGEVFDAEGVRLINREFRGLSGLPELDAREPQEQVFTLYYKSTGDGDSEIQFIVEDNFGQGRTLNVSFISEKTENKKMKTKSKAPASEFKSFYKIVQNNEGQKCKYPILKATH